MRLIDGDELEQVLRPILTDESCPLHIAAAIDMNIDLMPKVDAVPVVMCKDCKYYERSMGYCERLGITINDEDYCSYGERKDGGDGCH